MLQPLPRRAAFGEGLARAEALGEIGEDLVIVARLADRARRIRCIATSSGSLAAAPISSRSSVIVAGSTMSACRAVAVQASLVHDQRVELRKGAAQAVESW